MTLTIHLHWFQIVFTIATLASCISIFRMVGKLRKPYSLSDAVLVLVMDLLIISGMFYFWGK